MCWVRFGFGFGLGFGVRVGVGLGLGLGLGCDVDPDLVEDVGGLVALERRVTCEELEDKDADGPPG